MQSRLLGLAEKAADCVGRSIDEGDAKTALTLLKGLGVLSEPPAGSDDPAELERERVKAQRDRAQQAKWDQLTDTMLG
jgi:hypothetical protein